MFTNFCLLTRKQNVETDPSASSPHHLVPSAVCPNAPITGPGTLIVMTLGTFVNLVSSSLSLQPFFIIFADTPSLAQLFVLWYQSEAPYNLAYQIVATDGAAFGMLNRLIQPEFNLSQFHYAFVPLAIMSCVPLALAATLNDYPSYHVSF